MPTFNDLKKFTTKRKNRYVILFLWHSMPLVKIRIEAAWRDSVWLIFIIHLVRGLNIVVLDIPLTSYDRFSIWQLAGKVVSELGFIKMNGTTLHDY